MGEPKTITLPQGKDTFNAVAKVLLTRLMRDELKLGALPVAKPVAVKPPEVTPVVDAGVPVVAKVEPVDAGVVMTPPPPPPLEESSMKTIGYVATGVGAAGVVTGAIAASPFVRADQLAKLDVNGKSSNTFDGKGSTESNNKFSGTITCTVLEVLPNGHLIISGEKQIGVAKNVDILKFSGQIDPVTIQPGNTVASTQIANVRIEQKGRGAQADAQGIGWLGRFFLNILPL